PRPCPRPRVLRPCRGAVLMAKTPRTKNKDSARRAKKKVSLLVTERVEYVDWKDANLLRRFMSDRAKGRARRVTGISVKQQPVMARASNTARALALRPDTARVTPPRGPNRGDGDRGRRREREEERPADEAVEQPDATVEGAEAAENAE